MLRRVKVSDALLRALALLFFMLSLLVGGVYLIIFLNPYVPINPFPPPSPQPVARLTPEGPILEITFPPLNPSEPSANEGGKNRSVQGGAGGVPPTFSSGI